ncbi:MAG: hypothetical protein EBT86_01210 [Actinobacteria bacterium]|nr:hypothetical protein [Actinomycetota bacterium]
MVEKSTKSDTQGTQGTYSISTVFAIATAFAVFALFLFKSQIPNFWVILWVGTPVTLYIASSLLALASQTINCGQINPGNAFLGGLMTPVASIVFLGLASLSWLRVPIASAFAPLLVSQNFATLRNFGRVNNTNFTSPHLVDIRQSSLQALEAQSPAVLGISYAYYLFFAVLFGQVFASNISITC